MTKSDIKLGLCCATCKHGKFSDNYIICFFNFYSMPELTEYKEYYYLCTLFEAKAEIENYLNKHNIHGLVQKWEQGELK